MSVLQVMQILNITISCPSIIHIYQNITCSLKLESRGLTYEVYLDFGDSAQQNYLICDQTIFVSKTYLFEGNYTIKASIRNGTNYSYAYQIEVTRFRYFQLICPSYAIKGLTFNCTMSPFTENKIDTNLNFGDGDLRSITLTSNPVIITKSYRSEGVYNVEFSSPKYNYSDFHPIQGF